MKSSLLILTSPPASGKTYWIESFCSHFNSSEVIVISPLRALADECQRKWDSKVIVMTPEEWMIKRTVSSIAIFDEAHLLFYWGDTFRQTLWEVFYEISSSATQVIFLTATLAEWMKN